MYIPAKNILTDPIMTGPSFGSTLDPVSVSICIMNKLRMSNPHKAKNILKTPLHKKGFKKAEEIILLKIHMKDWLSSFDKCFW